MPPDAWFYVQDGHTKGPLALGALVDLLATLPDPQGTLVWSQGLEGWTKAGDVPALAPQLPHPITASLEREISDKWTPPADSPLARLAKEAEANLLNARTKQEAAMAELAKHAEAGSAIAEDEREFAHAVRGTPWVTSAIGIACAILFGLEALWGGSTSP